MGIEHRTTKVRRPESNGFIEGLHKTLLDEHFRIAGRTTWYESVEQMFKRGLPKTTKATEEPMKQAA